MPEEIVFDNIEVNQVYEAAVLVRNLTKVPRHVRIEEPKAKSVFRCDYDMKGPIAPGLSLELLISFECNSIAEFHDVLIIKSEK